MKNNQTGELPEVRWDRLLRIKTAGRDDSSADQYRYPYEPTPYSVLERLAGSGWIRKGNILLDYGCGKGRVGLFLSCQTRCRSIGVEYDPRIYEKALENQSSCVSSGRSSFVLANAEHYAVPASVDRVYFFNPFSLELQVMYSHDRLDPPVILIPIAEIIQIYRNQPCLPVMAVIDVRPEADHREGAQHRF